MKFKKCRKALAIFGLICFCLSSAVWLHIESPWVRKLLKINNRQGNLILALQKLSFQVDSQENRTQALKKSDKGFIEIMEMINHRVGIGDISKYKKIESWNGGHTHEVYNYNIISFIDHSNIRQNISTLSDLTSWVYVEQERYLLSYVFWLSMCGAVLSTIAILLE